MTGNTAGIESVVDNIEAPASAVEVSYYEVQSGDSLWKIAEKTLGNGADYQKIFDANREVIIDADKIFPGQKLRIPAAA